MKFVVATMNDGSRGGGLEWQTVKRMDWVAVDDN